MSSYMTVSYEVTRADVPEQYLDIVDEIGLDVFLKLVRLCGGEDLYIPRWECLIRGPRDRDIRARFNGGNYTQLAREYRLSVRQVRKIINGRRG